MDSIIGLVTDLTRYPAVPQIGYSVLGAVIVIVLTKRMTWRILRVIIAWPLLIVSGAVFIGAGVGALILGIPVILCIMLAGKGDWIKNLSSQKDKDEDDESDEEL